MAEIKKVLISLPETLLCEVDMLAQIDNKNRSELIREAMKFYLGERKKEELREKLRIGYQQMSALNLLIAEEGIEADNEVACNYEKSLGSWK